MTRGVVKIAQEAVFLNIPYDERFRTLYLAYIAGLVHLGLEPRVTLSLPSGKRRLDKISELIESCRYSIHDLSWVALDRNPEFISGRSRSKRSRMRSAPWPAASEWTAQQQ